MSFLHAIIFDVDGTLADTERDGHRVAFNRAFAAAGLPWHWTVDLYGTLLEVAGGKERIQFYLDCFQPEAQPPVSDRELPQWIAALHRRKTTHYKELLREGNIPLRPGVRRLITTARDEGIRLAIATTSALDNVLALLETALDPDSPNWFEVIAAGDVVPAKKPAPDIYHYVLQAMQIEPQHCLVIEDSQHGLQAASQANLMTLVTLNDYTRHHNFAGAALVIDHLGEPDLPFQVLQGTQPGQNWVDLMLANQLLKSLHHL
ncbi:MAG: HAD family hydrolase [Synechococcales cyanobacterium M58_A2018_015]|nr:HAD family hydrolase [Synechococcales cyanobacterium M58_A2018_015]